MRLARCEVRLQHALRTLPIEHQRLGHDLDAEPLERGPREELPVLAPDAEVLREAADRVEDVPANQGVGIAEHVAQQARVRGRRPGTARRGRAVWWVPGAAL